MKAWIQVTHHVEIGQSTDGRPEEGSCLDRFDPHSVSEEHAENGNALVIIGASHGTRDVPRHYGDERSSHQARSGILQAEVED